MPQTPTAAALSPTAQGSAPIPIPAALEGAAAAADGAGVPSPILAGSSPVLPGLGQQQAAPKTPTAPVQTLLPSAFMSSRAKEEDGNSVVGRRAANSISDTGLGKASAIGSGPGAVGGGGLGAASPVHGSLIPGGGVGFVGGASPGVGLNASDSAKRVGLGVEDRVRSAAISQLVMSQNKMLEQTGGKPFEPSNSGEDGANRVFSPPIGSGQQWRPHAPDVRPLLLCLHSGPSFSVLLFQANKNYSYSII